jgi:diguanylate cyclase (GGDEF)-like protein
VSDPTRELLERIVGLADERQDLVVFLEAVAELARDLAGADAASVMLMDKSDSSLVVASCAGVDAEQLRRISFEPGEGIAGRVLESGATERYDDVIGEPQFVTFPWQEGRVHALLVVPVSTPDRVVGVLSLHAEQPARFGALQQAWTELLARQVAADVENAWLRETTRVDPLTRMLNRAGFRERLEIEYSRCRRHAWPLSLLAIDIDQFRAVNELHGRFVGDLVLRELARRVADEVRIEDVLARWEGELFVLALPQAPTAAAEKIAERICYRIQQRAFRSRRGAIPLTVSAGVATTGDGITRAAELIDRAQQALVEAQTAGGNRVAVVR